MRVSNIILCECVRTDAFYPFSVLHTLWELRIGAISTIDKIRHFFPDARLNFHGRPKQIASWRERFKAPVVQVAEGDILIMRADMLINTELYNWLKNIIEGRRQLGGTGGIVRLESDGAMIGMYLPADKVQTEWRNDIDRLTDFGDEIYRDAAIINIPTVMPAYLWHCINLCGEALEDDLNILGATPDHEALKQQGVFAVNPDKIHIGRNVSIAPTVVLDASEGPIIIDDNAVIMPQSTILGPTFIGANSTVKIGAKIYGGSNIGPVCKVGGEIEASIIHGYSNKQHDGFLGHSFLGEWVNIGADTNTSDLKNNYTTVKVILPMGPVDTGSLFLGVLMGDHCKTGINTMLNTGSVIGVSCNIFGSDYCKKTMPSFSWGCGDGSTIFSIERALNLARTVMARRGKTLAENEELLLRMEYEECYD